MYCWTIEDSPEIQIVHLNFSLVQGFQSASVFSCHHFLAASKVKNLSHKDTKSEEHHGVWKSLKKVSFNIASEASYVYILSGQKLIKNAKNGPF